MDKAIFQIAPLSCPGCGKGIEDSLLSHEGIQSVRIFPGLGKIRIEYDKRQIDYKQLQEIISDWCQEVKLAAATGLSKG
ncbi:MAG: heavy-metal-associated domain-containing protein [Desulfitobacterium sp.]|nr:heavy-metal-associated domain-containing protein [Desulfitobacterium sp.]